MSDVVDLATERARRTEPQPDAEHVCEDEHGVRWFRFTCRFEDGGKEWDFDLWARDRADAGRRLLLVSSGRVDGQVFVSGTVP